MSYSVKYEDIGLMDYKETWDYQATIFKELIVSKKEKENISESGTEHKPGTLIFVEHPHVYTLGKSGSENNLLLDYLQLRARDAKFFRIDRGGDITYHGPGQIVGYPIFDLEAIGIGLKEYIFRLEESVILTIGVAMIGTVITGVVKKNFLSMRHTQAVILAQNKIEEVLNEGYNSDDLDEGYYENPLNPVNETGDTSGVFTQFWDIEDVNPIEKAKLIKSTVLWLDADGVEKEVTLTAVCIDESN